MTLPMETPKLGLSAKPTKTPWFLRMPKTIQPIRQRLNQWNWRQKTALVTALAITATGVFYQQRANAAAIAWPAVFSGDFLVKLFVSIGVSQTVSAAIEKKVKETAEADSDTWLYSKRKLRVRGYEYDDDGSNKTLIYSVDAQAEAAQNKTYDTSGTDTKRSPSTLDPDDVLDYVGENANLRRGMEVTYAVLVLRNGSWDRRRPETKWLETYTDYYGGYVKPLTDAEIQEDLDNRRRNWNRYGRGRYTWPPLSVL